MLYIIFKISLVIIKVKFLYLDGVVWNEDKKWKGLKKSQNQNSQLEFWALHKIGTEDLNS